MTGFFRKTAIFFAAGVLLLSANGQTGPVGAGDLVLTHADAAIILAKYSGLFNRYVKEDADLNECVAFLNKIGVYFNLMEVVSGAEFKVGDCARVMGQIELVFSGEAEFVGGKVKLPNNIESWVEFCILSDVRYLDGYRTMQETLRVGKMRGL